MDETGTGVVGVDVEPNGRRAAKAAPALGEIGSSGLIVSGGRPDDEFHRKLRGTRAQRVYREMQDNDPVIGAILFAVDMILRKAEWKVEPSPTAENEAAAVKVAEFGWQALNDMSAPWDQVVSAILSFLPYGFSFLETVYKVRGGDDRDPTRRSEFDDGKIGWRKWGLRAQESLVRWEVGPDGGLRAFVQRQQVGAPVAIPIEKGLLFRTTSARGNPEGRALLRNAYRPWYFKKRIEEIEGIGIERDLAGLPVARVPPEYLDENASAPQKAVLEVVKKIVRDIRRDAQEGIVYPKVVDPDHGHDLWDLELLTTGGRRQFDTDAIIARYDQRIAMTVLADFILLGHEKVGSRALGVEKVDLFLTALTAYADELCAVVNSYGFPRLIAANGLDRSLSPKLGYEPLETPDLASLGKFVSDIASAGATVDRSLEEHLRERAGFPPPETEPTEV